LHFPWSISFNFLDIDEYFWILFVKKILNLC
jgi:hypothetical protein